jgi:hypothetical protein
LQSLENLKKKENSELNSNLNSEVFPRIHGMVFNPSDGILKKLTVDFSRRIGSLDHIYGLYENSHHHD